MSTTKKIKNVLPRPLRPGMVGDGFRVFNYFPSGYNIRKEISPFLMLDFGPSFDFGPSDKPRGVDVHPHRGFETVTIAYKGAVEHHDSAGNSGIIYPGDVQWMTAASGILHKEFHETEFSKKGGPFEMIQLWVNLPKQYKMSPPKYQEISAKNKVLVPLAGNAGEVNVIAGDFNGQKGVASTFTPINLFSVKLNKDGQLDLDIPANHNTSILVVEGELEVNGQKASLHDFVLFANEGEHMQIIAKENAVFLIMSGEPIDEPVAQYGPFVMNTQQELMEAIDDFNKGKFGRLD
jgi:hypothetical protein